MASWFSPDRWLPSVERFLRTWRIVRICPNKISAPKEELSVNVLTLAISLAIFLFARVSVAGANVDIGVVALAMVISVTIVFMTGYVILIREPNKKGLADAPKWGAFFVMTWLTSLLLLILIDALPFWLGYSRTTTRIIDGLFGPGRLSAGTKDGLRAVFFGTLAIMLLLYKTKRMDPKFHIFERCAVGTVAVGLLVNTALLSFFIYGHMI